MPSKHPLNGPRNEPARNPVITMTQKSSRHGNDAGPWTRWAARSIDFALLSSLSYFLLEIAFDNPAIINSIKGTRAVIPLLVVGPPFLAFLVESLVYAVAGNTVGKAILGISVLKPGGIPLSAGEYLSRTLSVWVRAYGVCLPPATLFLFLAQYNRVSQGRPASYDEPGDHRVICHELSFVRKIVAGLSVAALLGLLVFSITVQYAEFGPKGLNKTIYSAQGVTSVSTPEAYNWPNPWSGISVPIAKSWLITFANETAIFTDKNNQAKVTMTAETIDNYTMAQFIQYMRLDDSTDLIGLAEGESSQFNGNPAWWSRGSYRHRADARSEVLAVQIGQDFWTITIVQFPPFADTEAALDKIKKSLLESIR